MSIFEELNVPANGIPLNALLGIGRAVGGLCGNAIIGRDSGRHGQMFLNALCSGMMSAGANVRDAGIVPTPTLALAARGRGCGVMIAPPETEEECVSLKFWNENGTMFTDAQMSSTISSARSEIGLPAYSSVGNMIEHTGSIQYHKSRIMNALTNADCPVVLDCSSNCASLIAPSLLTEMGCDVISINSQLNGQMCQYKGIDEGSLRDLTEIVNKNKGEIGIAVNADGSRISAIDETGTYMDGETILALFAGYIKPKKIVLPVNASMTIGDITGADIILSATGHGAIGEAVMKEQAEFGGSTNGSFIFPDLTYSPDGIYSAALLSKIAGEGRLKDMIDSLPKYCKEDDLIKYNGRASDIGKKIDERVSSLEYESLANTDGWRVEMDSGWYLIRFSTKDPVIRITAEARDKVYMNCLMDIAKDVVNDALK